MCWRPLSDPDAVPPAHCHLLFNQTYNKINCNNDLAARIIMHRALPHLFSGALPEILPKISVCISIKKNVIKMHYLLTQIKPVQ